VLVLATLCPAWGRGGRGTGARTAAHPAASSGEAASSGLGRLGVRSHGKGEGKRLFFIDAPERHGLTACVRCASDRAIYWSRERAQTTPHDGAPSHEREHTCCTAPLSAGVASRRWCRSLSSPRAPAHRWWTPQKPCLGGTSEEGEGGRARADVAGTSPTARHRAPHPARRRALSKRSCFYKQRTGEQPAYTKRSARR